MAGRKRVAILGALLALAAFLALGLAFTRWRADKLALLEPLPTFVVAGSQPASPPGLLLFGDSRIAQWRPAPARPYPVAVVGFPGASAIQLGPRFAAALEAHRPALVILQLGVNDAVAASVAAPSDRGAARDATIAAIDTMAAAARAHGARLVILAIVPPLDMGFPERLIFGDRVARTVAEVNAALPAVAARHGATLVDPLPFLIEDGEVPEAFVRDWLHFTPAGYAALEPLLPEKLQPETTGEAG